jgi:MFS family permease
MDPSAGSPNPALRERLLREPPRPVRIRESPRARWYVVGAVCVGAFMGQLDVSIVTLALPHIGASLHATAGEVRWVSLSYLLALACTLIPVGRLADRLGRKLLYTQGFAVFTAGSLLCGLAPNLDWLIAARVLQALGAALLQANSVALIAQSLPARALARGLGIQGAAQAIGLALGPALGGLLIALGGWRLIFFVNLPAGVFGIALARLLLPRSRDASGELLAAARGTPDPRGDGPTAGERREPSHQGPGAGSRRTATGERAGTGREPTGTGRRAGASPRFDRRVLALGLAGAMASYAVMFGALYVVPYYLAAAHTAVALAGLELAALPLALGIAAPLAGRASERLGPRTLTGGGLLLAALGMVALALRHTGAGLPAGLALVGAGLGAFIPVNNAAVMRAGPRSRAGMLSGVLNTTRTLGTALGVALAGALYTAAASAVGGHAGTTPLDAAEHGLSVTLLVLAAIALAIAVAQRIEPRRAPPWADV